MVDAITFAEERCTRFGMSTPLGLLTYGRSMAGPFLKSPFDLEERNYSEQTAERIDDESRRIVDETHKRVVEILLKRREPMERISQALIRKETLDRTELDILLNAPEQDTAAEAPLSIAKV